MMRYAGLRISDVGTASRDHIRGNRPEKHAVKNHRMIRVELPAVVLTALDQLPHARQQRRTTSPFRSSRGSRYLSPASHLDPDELRDGSVIQALPFVEQVTRSAGFVHRVRATPETETSNQ